MVKALSNGYTTRFGETEMSDKIIYQSQSSWRLLIWFIIIPIVGWIGIPFALWRRRFRKYQITNKSVRMIKGLRGNTYEIPFGSVSNVNRHRTILEWISGCSTLIVRAHSGESIEFNWLANYEYPESLIKVRIEK